MKFHFSNIFCFLISIVCTVLFVSITFTSCSGLLTDETAFVINEVMANNRTGLMAEDGNLYDWIEVQNISEKPANLGRFILAKDSCRKSWNFPDTIVQPGKCVLVFATKSKLHNQLHCDFKLNDNGEQLQLRSPRGRLICEVLYKKLKSDQSLCRNGDSIYLKTYHQTPGYPNDTDGYNNYLKDIETQRSSPVLLWEYLNNGKKPNCGNNVCPSVELKNVSSDSVSLSGYELASKIDADVFIRLPKRILAPGEIISIVDTLKVLDAKTLVLRRAKKFVDGMNTHKVYPGVSMLRQQGRSGFLYSLQSTIGEENTTEAYDKISNSPKLHKKPGTYAAKNIYISIDNKGADVYYTLDGSEPTLQSPVYSDSILIDKSTIFRAFSYKHGELQSESIFATYLLGTTHTLPVVCVTINPDYLYDSVSGIYMKGLHADSIFPYVGANYWRDWERPAHIEFRDSLGGFSYECGIKIFGGFSRALDKKSFQIKFRAQYGKGKLKYNLFNDGMPCEFNSFVLRSGSQDIQGTMVRDEFFTSLMAETSPSLLVQSYRPVILYINTEYYGIYFIREKINKHFVARHLGSEPDSTQLLMQQHLPLFGTSRDYINVVNYAIHHDMCDTVHYNYMARRVNLESLIDFKLGEFYSSNTDAGNIRYCRTTDPQCDGRWHWIYYDLDATFHGIKELDFYIQGNSLNAPISSVSAYNVLICRLLTNPQFRKLFLDRWAYHKKHTFAPKHAVEVFDNLINTIKPEMERNCLRWPSDMSYASWQNHVKDFRNSILTRVPRLQKEIDRMYP